MYIRYRNLGTLDEIELRDVRFFRLEPYSVEKEDGVCICDAQSEDSRLSWFNSRVAALKVFNAICLDLENGKQYFDLTKYDKDGNLI